MPRKPNTREIPPRLELECLKVLWREGEADGAKVREALEERSLAYTTIVTLLERLVTRGAATRRKSGRRFLYRATIEIGRLRSLAVRELVEDFFDGSAKDLGAYVSGANNTPVIVPESLTNSAQNPETPQIDTTLL